MLKYIAYVSKQSYILSDQQMLDLLDAARSKNESLGITGVLIHLKGNFVQFIEGPDSFLHEVYHCISTDKRHTDVLTIAEGDLDERRFENWSMAFKKLNHKLSDDMPGFIDFKPDALFEFPVKEKGQALPALTLIQNYINDLAS